MPLHFLSPCFIRSCKLSEAIIKCHRWSHDKGPGECPRECPRKSGCPRECPGECLEGPECPKGVPRVSPEFHKGVRTLQRHSRDTFCTLWGPKGPRDTPLDTLGHPDFRGHSLGHSPGHFGPEGPEASCRGLGMSQSEMMFCVARPCDCLESVTFWNIFIIASF